MQGTGGTDCVRFVALLARAGFARGFSKVRLTPVITIAGGFYSTAQKCFEKVRTGLKNGDNSVMRTLLRIISRPLLAAVFIHDGLDALRNPADHVERFRKMEPTLEKIGLPPMLTSDAKLLSRLSGAATAVTALGLALGKYPRICALILAVVNLPISVVNNPVWAANSTEERKEYTRGLVAGGSLAGGLGMVLADGNGQPSLRVRREIVRAAAAGK